MEGKNVIKSTFLLQNLQNCCKICNGGLKGKRMDKKKLFNEVKRYVFMVLGCISYSLSLRMFLIPNNIVGGGVSGAASLIEILTGLPAGIFILVINVPILILGLKLMGWRFIINCLITTATLSGTTELLTLFGEMSITDDKILSALYGGILQGIAVGFFIKYETSSGGTELLGRITQHVIHYFSIATHVAIFDALVVVLGAILLNDVANILYALILIFVSAKVSDLIVMGMRKGKLCYIITEKAENISEFLLTHSPRGITLMNGEGMYTKKPKGVLLTCVKFNQIASLKKWIKELDEEAFVIVTDANEVFGKGFSKLDKN